MSDGHQHNADNHHEHPHSHDGDRGHNQDHHHHHGHEHGHHHDDDHHHHDHGHDQDHDHHHHDHDDHSHAGTGDMAKITALLAYMVDHNRDHAGELADMAHTLSHADLGEAAALLGEGVGDFERGNEKLARALELVRGGER